MQRVIRYVPNTLTVARLASLPLIVWVYGLHAPAASWPAAVILLIAALSDIADGFIARRFHVSSEFGLWVDPIADRLLFFTIVGMLWYYGTLPWLAALPLLIRDGIILALALPMRRLTVAKPEISRWGKAANFLLMGALLWFMVDQRAFAWVFFAFGGTLYVGTGLLYGYRALTWGRRRQASA